MESIGESAFEDCKRLETIELSSKLQTIENEAFVRCGLKYLEIPASVTNIDEEAFEASFISDFTVPNHIKRIAHTACFGCKSLKTVHIPKSVNEIGVRAFDECKQLESVSIEADIKAKEEAAAEAARIEAEKKAAEEAEAKRQAAIEAAENSSSYNYVESEQLDNVDVNGISFAVAPVTGHISSRYGVNESVRNHTHKGLDIAASNGTSIFAVADGTVDYAQFNSGGYGNLVIISHGNGVQTYYAHCSKLFVSEGDTVSAGDVIAAVGSTGHSTGNHLHFEVRINGSQVNPQNFVYKDE